MDNKRKIYTSDELSSKKIKMEIDEFNFDGKEKLNSFNEYLYKVNVLKDRLNKLVDKKKDEKLQDDILEIKNAKNDIKNLKHNLYYKNSIGK